MKKALVVEDNTINQKVITRFLQRLGFSVDIAHNGVEGVDCFKSNPYGVVFMGLMMPIMDGYEATKRIREYERATLNGSHEPTPIIAVTANVNASEASCIEVGMNGYLNKPLRIDNLKQAIESIAHLDVG